MAYVSYAVGPSVPLGPPSVGAIPERAQIQSRPSGLTPEEAQAHDDAIVQKLWDNSSGYRAGMTDEQGSAWFVCYRQKMDPNRCRREILASAAPPGSPSASQAGMFGMSTGMLLAIGAAGAGVLWLVFRK